MADAPKKKMPTVPWLPMRLDLADDPAVIAIFSKTDCVDEAHVVGKLHKVWTWFNRHTTDGYARGVTPEWFDRDIGVTGFTQAMIDVGWLEVDEGGVRLPNFEEFNGASAKKRLQSARRMAKKRNSDTGSATDGEQPRDKRYAASVTNEAQKAHLEEEKEVEEEKELEEEKDEDEKKKLKKVVSSDETRRGDQKNLSTDAQRGEQEIWAEADAMAVRTIAKLKLTPKRADRELMLKCARLVINDQLPEHWLLDATEAYDKRTTPKRNPWGFVTRCLQNKAVEDYGKDLNTLLATVKVPGWLLGPPENKQTSREDAGTQRKEPNA